MMSSTSMRCAFVLFAIAALLTSPMRAAERHGLSTFGDLKYPADFKAFDYVNPDAPKGGRLALRQRAARIWRAGGRWHAEALGGTVFAAPLLVNAAGAWGDEVAALAGLPRIGLQPKRRTACIIDPGAFDCTDWPMLGDVGHSWYVRPEARRKLMVSPADETDSAPLDAQPDELDVAIGIDRMQQALDIPVTRVEHKWAGLRTFTPDRGLAIGAGVEPGFFWMVGQGGYGIQTAPAAGRLLAALIEGRVPEEDVTPAIPLCDPRRFSK